MRFTICKHFVFFFFRARRKHDQRKNTVCYRCDVNIAGPSHVFGPYLFLSHSICKLIKYMRLLQSITLQHSTNVSFNIINFHWNFLVLIGWNWKTQTSMHRWHFERIEQVFPDLSIKFVGKICWNSNTNLSYRTFTSNRKRFINQFHVFDCGKLCVKQRSLSHIGQKSA